MKLPKKEELNSEDEHYLFEKDTDPYENFVDSNRIDEIIKLVKKYSKGKKVLDIGCAQGNIATLLAEEGFCTIAFDLSQNFLEYARKKREFGEISYVCGNALCLPFRKETFDAIILGELIEHIAYPEMLIKEAKRCLKNGGIILITTPNNHFFLGMDSGNKPPLFHELAYQQRVKLLKKQFGPSGADHLFVFNAENLTKLLKNQSLKVFELKWINSCFINNHTYNILKIFPDYLLHLFDNLITKIPFLNEKLSMSLCISARK